MLSHLGTKRHCPKCDGKFYDMGALEVRCPKCEFVFPIHLTSREEPLPQASHEAAPSAHAAAADELDALEEMGKVVELDDLGDLEEYDDIEHLEEVEDHHESGISNKNSDDADDDMFIDDIGSSGMHIVDDLDEYEERDPL